MESHRIVREDRLARPRKSRYGGSLHDQPAHPHPLADHLITPANSALAVIDYQPSQIASVRSIDHDLLLKNVITTVKVAKLFGVPIIHSTINVANGQGPTLPGLAEELADTPPIDRTQINSWEDVEFLAAVRATGRRKLILCALWTEVCMTFPALDALREEIG